MLPPAQAFEELEAHQHYFTFQNVIMAKRPDTAQRAVIALLTLLSFLAPVGAVAKMDSTNSTQAMDVLIKTNLETIMVSKTNVANDKDRHFRDTTIDGGASFQMCFEKRATTSTAAEMG